MPNATITSTASTFGTISGTLAADQSTITGTVSGIITGTLSGSVGVPGPAGAGVPVGGTAGQVLAKIDGTNYNTQWVASGGGSFLPLAGGAMDADATVTLEDTVVGTVSEVGGYGFAVSSAADPNSVTNVLFDRVLVKNESYQTTLTPTGIEFPDATFQTTAFTGSYLPLAGGTMTGAIVFDGTSGQYINKGNFDTSRGGNYGISLVCSIGYEFNWQAGWLTTTQQSSTTPRPLYLDSLAGTTLRSWDSATDTGVEVSHTGVNVSNSSIYYVNIAPDLLKVFEATNELGVSIAHDSIAIQHIDTPNVTAYMTNEYIGFEDLSGSPHSAWIEHDVITVQDATDTTQMRSTGLTLSAGGSITFGDATVQTTAYTGGGGGLITSVTAPLAVTSGDLSVDLTGYLPLAGGAMTGDITRTGASNNYSISNDTISIGANDSSNVVQIVPSQITLIGTGSVGSTMAKDMFRVGTYYPTDQFGKLEYNLLTIADAAGNTRVTPSGVILPTAGSITFGDATTQTTAGYPLTGNPSGFIGDAPFDSQYNARYNGTWQAFQPGFAADAPYDGNYYARQNTSWQMVTPKPSYSDAVWYGNAWYSATVRSLTDGYGNYYNALTL